jgi:hypothetical protein
MSNQTFNADMLELRKLLSSLSTVELLMDDKLVEEKAFQFESPWNSIFSKDSFLPPMLSEEERGNLQVLTNHAAESMKSRNALMDDCIVDVIAPQLACLLAMPVPSGHQSRSQILIGSSKSPLDRCKSSDDSLELCEVIGHAKEFR